MPTSDTPTGDAWEPRRRRVVAPPVAQGDEQAPGSAGGRGTGSGPWTGRGIGSASGPSASTGHGPRAAADPILPRRAVRRQALHEGAPEAAESLTAERLLRVKGEEPETGWRRMLYRVTGGNIRPGESPIVVQRQAQEARVARRLTGPARFVPVLTRKGGVGKTTVTTLLGMTMATLRDDRVIAVDANPDRGTLAERVPGRIPHTVRDVVHRAQSIATFSDMSELVTRDATRLDVLASDTDPATAEAFGEDDYKIVADVVSRHYSIVLTDCGTGMVHSVMRGTLDLADSLVLVSGASVDEARLASETLTWLEARGYEHLVRSAVVAINTATPQNDALDVRELVKHFESRCRVVTQIPFDPHLAEGASIQLGSLLPQTRAAVMELAASVVDGLGPGRE